MTSVRLSAAKEPLLKMPLSKSPSSTVMSILSSGLMVISAD